MQSFALFALFAGVLVSTNAGRVTETRTIIHTQYHPYEECCAPTPYHFGGMPAKPSSVKEFHHQGSPIAPKASPSSPAAKDKAVVSEPKAKAKPSQSLSAPKDQCTAGPTAIGADCSATGYCCPPASCDVTTLKCISVDDTPTEPKEKSSTAAATPEPTPAGGDDSCTDPKTLGADCSATGQCCTPLACDASSNTCVST